MDTSPYAPEEPIAAIATALAPAALGIVRCSGSGCIELLTKLFSRPAALRAANANTLVYGWICEPAPAPAANGNHVAGDATTASEAATPATAGTDAGSGSAATATARRRIDEVLIAVYRAPKSFTGEDMAEISCHGGVAVVTAIYKLLLANGFRAAERGEFTFRAYINGKTDLTRAEAVREIIESKTDASRSRAAGRLAGNLYAAIDDVKRRLVDTLAAIEVEIEYPEDEETIADSFDTAALEAIARDLTALAASWRSEKLYQDGARVVLCGRTNAGKSSLFNALLKEDRAIVSDIAGTTRDWLESWVDFDGIPARLFDTAGLRETTDAIEQRGVALTHDLTADADLVLYLVDATVGITEDDKAFFTSLHEKRNGVAENATTALAENNAADSELAAAQEAPAENRDRQGTPLVLVWNKADKCAAVATAAANGGASAATSRNAPAAGNSLQSGNSAHTATAPAAFTPPACPEARAVAELSVSAKTGAGIAELCASVRAELARGTESSRTQTGLGSERQRAAVTEALERVQHALALTADYALDAVVQDLEDALDALGAVTGDITPDDVLASVFAHFCVGK